MKSKTKAIKLINLIVAVLVALFCMGQAFAWFIADRISLNSGFNGSSAGAYFAYGTGEQDKPFGINTKYHMYNLAWLQNTGRLVDENGKQKQYYFEIDPEMTGTLDLKDFWLPPIGNDEYPFIGIFNGNGKEISNLQITTNKNKLTANPSGESYEFSNAVGLFGKTSSTSEISNFILNNPYVEVASSNTKYSNRANSNLVVGIAIGHVAGKASSIGIYAHEETTPKTTLDIKRTGYSTFNSILGELAEGVTSSVTGGGSGSTGSGGSGNAFGSTFDVESLLWRMQQIDANKKSDTPSWRLPDTDNQSNNPVPAELEKVPFAVTADSTYEGADAVEVVSNKNIGYFLGNQNKITTTKQLKFGLPMIEEDGQYVMQDDGDVPRWFYTYTHEDGTYDTFDQAPSYYSSVFKPISKKEMDEMPEDILDLLKPVGTKERFTAVRLSQTFTNNEHPNSLGTGVSNWSFHGQISIMGNTYGRGLKDSNGYVIDESGEYTYDELTDWGTPKGDMYNDWGGHVNYFEYTRGIFLPNNAIWFKPAQTGTIKFVMYAESMGEGFALVKITREGATAENPFNVNPNVNGWGYGEDVYFSPIMRELLPSGVLIYYEHEVTAEEVAANNVEYMILQYGNNGADFLYMDIGSVAADDEDDNFMYDPNVNVSAIDFIYKNVEIAQSGSFFGNFIIGGNYYEATGTTVYFTELKVALQIVYVRLTGTYTMQVDRGTSTEVTDTRGKTLWNNN